MADKVYPSAKSNLHHPQSLNGGGGAAANGGGAPAFPSTKAQIYGANRPMYRPQPPKPHRRSRRSCCCVCCLWITLVLLGLILLAAIAGGIFYILYRPHHPTFSVTTLRLSTFNISSSDSLASRLDLAVTARNPNRKIVFVYDDITIGATSNGVPIADGSFPSFIHGTKNTTVLNTTLTSSSSQALDTSTASDLKKSSSLPLMIDLETKAGVKIGSLRTKKIGIKVSCDGISVGVPKGKAPAAAASPDASCKVKIHIKIWKWTI